MENLSKVIEGYFAENDIHNTICENRTYCCRLHFGDESRIECCDMLLIPEKDKLQMIFELPIYVKPAERVKVTRELLNINMCLQGNECFELDFLTGKIRYRTLLELPESAEQLDAYVDKAETTLIEQGNDILHIVNDASLVLERWEKDQNPTSLGERIMHLLGVTSKHPDDVE